MTVTDCGMSRIGVGIPPPMLETPAPFEVRFVRVPYDVDAEVAVAHQVGMPRSDVWEVELRTAVYRGRQTS